MTLLMLVSGGDSVALSKDQHSVGSGWWKMQLSGRFAQSELELELLSTDFLTATLEERCAGACGGVGQPADRYNGSAVVSECVRWRRAIRVWRRTVMYVKIEPSCILTVNPKKLDILQSTADDIASCQPILIYQNFDEINLNKTGTLW